MSRDALFRSLETLAAGLLPALLLVLCLALPGCGEGDEPDQGGEPPTSSTTPPVSEGGGSGDNVAACNAWLQANQCGDYDFSQALDCQLYAGTPCDISAYFDCLTENTRCTEQGGVSFPDTSGWTACTALAQCQ